MAATLELQLDDRPEGCWMICRGELDIASADRLREASRALMRGGIGFTIDLSGLEFVDCSGVRALGLVRREAIGRCARVHLHSEPDSPASRVLAIVDAASGSIELPPPADPPQLELLRPAHRDGPRHGARPSGRHTRRHRGPRARRRPRGRHRGA